MRNIQKNKFDISGENLNRGLKAEQKFKILAKKRGYEIVESKENQDINEHWDFELVKDNIRLKVDVKSMKKITRSDKKVQDKYAWIELHGVRKHDKGWLYGGKADLIAFETKKSFVLVKRTELIRSLEGRISNKVVSSPKEALYKDENGKYKRYKRKNRYDELILLELDELRNICWDEWKFNE